MNNKSTLKQKNMIVDKKMFIYFSVHGHPGHDHGNIINLSRKKQKKLIKNLL